MPQPAVRAAVLWISSGEAPSPQLQLADNIDARYWSIERMSDREQFIAQNVQIGAVCLKINTRHSMDNQIQ